MEFNKRTIRCMFLDEIEDAVNRGWHRAHKHQDSPSGDIITGCIYDAVESALYEWIDFGDVE